MVGTILLFLFREKPSSSGEAPFLPPPLPIGFRNDSTDKLNKDPSGNNRLVFVCHRTSCTGPDQGYYNPCPGVDCPYKLYILELCAQLALRAQFQNAMLVKADES